jgi:hypothetical protein
MGDIASLISTIAAGVAAVAALGTLIVAFLTLREGRATIAELRKVATEAAKETAAQEAIVQSTQRLVQASNVTATVLHSVFLETHAAREVEALLRIRTALADVATATQHMLVENPQPDIFYGARQGLRAALAGVPDAEQFLPASHRIARDNSIVQARQHELDADHEVEQAIKAAREKLVAANRQSNEAMDVAW